MNLHFDSFHEWIWSNTKKVFVMLSIDLPRAIFLHRTQQPSRQPFQLTEHRLNFGCTERFIVLESMQMIVVLVIHIRRSFSCDENTNSGLGSRAILSNKIRIKLSCLNVDYFLFSLFSLPSPFSPYIPISSTIFSSSQWKAQHNENPITCWGATMRLQWLLKCWFCPSKHISNGFYERTWMVITVTVLYSHGLGALGFPIESNPLCTNLFRKWFWDAIQILSIL